MNKRRITFLLFLFLITVSGSVFAQTVKYVAYFPVPYLTHKKITAEKVYFAGRDNGLLYKDSNAQENKTVIINGGLRAGKVFSHKDMELKTTSSSSLGEVRVNVGTDYGNNIIKNGNFVVDNSNSQLNIASTGATTWSAVTQLKADDSLNVKSIEWADPSTSVDSFTATARPSKQAFVKSTNNYSSSTASDTGFPNGTTNFCWLPLRIKGTYEYQYYLVAYNGDCPNFDIE